MVLARDISYDILPFTLNISLDQLSAFIILLDWPIYNCKSYISNRSTSLFGRRFSHLSNPIKSSIKMALGGSHTCYFPCWNLSLINHVANKFVRDQSPAEGSSFGSISPALRLTLSCDLTPAPTLVPTLVFAPIPTPVSFNELFK